MGRFEDIPAEAPTTSTRATDFWLHDGVLYGRTRNLAPHGEYHDTVDAFEKIRTLIDGKRRPLIFDARHVGWVQMKAREHVFKHRSELFTRAGVIVSRASYRIMKYAFGGAHRGDIPMKLCSDEEEAWQFIMEANDE